jgi:hypothetical protein
MIILPYVFKKKYELNPKYNEKVLHKIKRIAMTFVEMTLVPHVYTSASQ